MAPREPILSELGTGIHVSEEPEGEEQGEEDEEEEEEEEEEVEEKVGKKRRMIRGGSNKDGPDGDDSAQEGMEIF